MIECIKKQNFWMSCNVNKPNFLAPGRNPGRAIASASTLHQSFLRPHIFQTHDGFAFVFGVMIGIGPKFYSAIPQPCL